MAITAAPFSFDASAAGSLTKQLVDICRQYAQEDQISPGALEAYMQQCVKDMRDAQGEEREASGFSPPPPSDHSRPVTSE